ncbi:MAG: TonB-dependent receptor [Syntrophotaleaceae bacterium]
MKRGLFAACAVLALIAPPFGGGAVHAAEDGVYHLGEVVVSGEEKGVEDIGTTFKVTAEEIEKRGARTLDEAIEMLPGVEVRTGGDGAPRIDIRGFRTRHVKLLLNGTPFNSTNDGQFDPALISMENVAEIVVTTGGGSELYGSGGNAGVINIITKKGTLGAHGSLGFELGEVDASLLRATGSYGAEKYDVFLSASTYERDAFRLSNHFSEEAFEDGDERENSDRDRDNLFLNVGYQPDDATLLGLTFSYLNGERGKPPIIYDRRNDIFANNIRYEREDVAEEFNVQLAANHDFSGPVSIKGWAYFNTLNLEENTYDGADYDSQRRRNSGKTDSTTEISGVNLQLRYDLERLGAVTLGGMFENDDWEADGYVISVNNVTNDPDDRFDEDADFQLYSLSMEYQVSPFDNFGVVLGAGYHWQDRDEKDEEDYSYLIGLTYQLFEGTRLRANHSRKIRFPTISDLYDTNGGNPELSAETTLNYEAGIEQVLPGKTLLSLTGFYIDIEDFIERSDLTDLRENFEEYEFYGVEIGVENHYLDWLLVRATYSYLKTEDKGDSGRDELQNRPEHKVTLEATCFLPWGLTAYGSALYVDGNYYYNREQTAGGVVTLPENAVQAELPEYLVVDFKLNKSVAQNALDLYIGIDNVFDEDYEQSYGFPQPGRTFYGGATWKF